MVVRPLPTDLYLDTSFVVPAVLARTPQHERAVELTIELQTSDCYVSFFPILRVEYVQALANIGRHLRRGTGVDIELQRRFRLRRWERDVGVRRDWLRSGVNEFDLWLARFDRLAELPLSTTAWRTSLTIMADHQLLSNDALHVATAWEHGIYDFATFDAGFERLERAGDLTLWPRH